MLYRIQEWLADRTRVQYPRVRRVQKTKDELDAAAWGAVKRVGLFFFAVWALIASIALLAIGCGLLYFVYLLWTS